MGIHMMNTTPAMLQQGPATRDKRLRWFFPTVSGVVMEVGTRRLLHFNVTHRPTGRLLEYSPNLSAIRRINSR